MVQLYAMSDFGKAVQFPIASAALTSVIVLLSGCFVFLVLLLVRKALCLTALRQVELQVSVIVNSETNQLGVSMLKNKYVLSAVILN